VGAAYSTLIDADREGRQAFGLGFLGGGDSVLATVTFAKATVYISSTVTVSGFSSCYTGNTGVTCSRRKRSALTLAPDEYFEQQRRFAQEALQEASEREKRSAVDLESSGPEVVDVTDMVDVTCLNDMREQRRLFGFGSAANNSPVRLAKTRTTTEVAFTTATRMGVQVVTISYVRCRAPNGKTNPTCG
jgi:hypothetical protein